MLTVFISGVSILLIILLTVYLKNYRGLPQNDFNPVVLWIRAGIYFCSCFRDFDFYFFSVWKA